MRIDRLSMIEQYVIQCKTASLEELATHFGVSMNTIRRDVRQLLERGALEKVYGGVTIKTSQHAQLPLPYAIRASRNIAEKQEIGRLEGELKQKLLDIHLSYPVNAMTRIDNADDPRPSGDKIQRDGHFPLFERAL